MPLTSLKNSQGFSLIEILLALLLVAFMAAFVVFSPNNQRKVLKETVDVFRRSLRYARNEAILNNALVRIRINLEEEPIEYAIEVSTKKNLLLKTFKAQKDLDLAESKIQQEERQRFDQNFAPVDGLERVHYDFDPEVTFLGFSSLRQKELQRDSEFIIYFYPDGRVEPSLLVISSTQEAVAMSFSHKLRDYYYTYDLVSRPLESEQERILTEVYQSWQAGKLR